MGRATSSWRRTKRPISYTSGEVITKGHLDMTYGTMTARIKFPAARECGPLSGCSGRPILDTWDALGPTGWPGLARSM